MDFDGEAVISPKNWIDPRRGTCPSRDMQTNRTLLVATALFLTTAAVSLAGSPQMGTWKLNESKSTFTSKARTNTVTYTDAEGGMVKVEAEGVDTEGKPAHWTWTGKFDGKPYKLENHPIADMAAYKMVNDHTNDITMTKDGKTVVTSMVKVAKDGKSRTVTTTFSAHGSAKKMTDKVYYDKM